MASYNSDTIVVGVIGVGYVGEHLVTTFGKKFKVIGYDLSKARVEYLQSTPQMSTNPNITLQYSTDGLETCDVFCISVPTLLRDDKSVDDSYVKSAGKTVEQFAKKGATVVMESSVSVGMTRNVLGHLRKKDIYVGFSPERVDPGRVDPPCDEIPKIISGLDKASLAKVSEYYNQVFKTTVPVSSSETAEMCKLYENCFRMVNIAYANEAADECKKHKIDVYEMIKACSTKPFGFMPFYPGLGVGGHCIPVNPFYLDTNCDFKLLMQATHNTLQRPQQKAAELVHEHSDAQNILVVGVAFKPGESYTMNAPGLEFAKSLKNEHKKNVIILDPLVTNLKEFETVTFGGSILRIEQKQVDIVVIAMKQHKVDCATLDFVCNLHKVPIIAFCDI
jgi:nucleotide sugar dehydrogenase